MRDDRTAAPPPPRLDPLAPDPGRPLLSVMLPVYNDADYLREALRSVLDQDPGARDMQIQVIDNASTEDDPEAVVRELGQGRVEFHRHPRNLGLVENFNACLRRARGEWVHILCSDDMVLPGFYARARQTVLAHPELGACVCRVIHIDEIGQWTGFSEIEARTPGVLDAAFAARVLVDQRIQVVGIIVRRSVYEAVGGFRPELPLCLDWDMWKRLALHARVHYDPEPLACFRLHRVSVYASALKTGATVADERRAIEISCGYVPPEQTAWLRREALRMAAIRAIRSARRMAAQGRRDIAFLLLGEALRCSLAPEVLARVLYAVPRLFAPPPAPLNAPAGSARASRARAARA
jgi:hypothetical protein